MRLLNSGSLSSPPPRVGMGIMQPNEGPVGQSGAWSSWGSTEGLWCLLAKSQSGAGSPEAA